jgi:hypothetical protein
MSKSVRICGVAGTRGSMHGLAVCSITQALPDTAIILATMLAPASKFLRVSGTVTVYECPHFLGRWVLPQYIKR